MTKSFIQKATLLTAALAMFVITPDGQQVFAKGSKAGKNPALAREAAIVRSPYYLKACEAYKKGNYRDAIANFELCDRNGGCCQWTHYYLGLSYQGINQLGPAYQQFQWVLQRGKDANLRRYSQYAADSLSYYASNRTYNGQGAIASSSRSGGGGGSSCSTSSRG
jgi:hypothetical protein